MADRDYAPDEWSDHDFFVITPPGGQEALREDLSWLPRADRVALSFRETGHGLVVLYDDGHLLEFAVFELDELALAAIEVAYPELGSELAALQRLPSDTAAVSLLRLADRELRPLIPGLAWNALDIVLRRLSA
jgi:hypothetical protein